MLINLLQRHHIWVFIFLSGLSGLALGHLGATSLGILAGPDPLPTRSMLPTIEKTSTRTPLKDYQAILQRDIFNSAGGGQNLASIEIVQTEKTTASKPAKSASRWILLGTISGGDSPLATLSSAGETTTYRLNDELPDNAIITAVKRDQIELSYPDGRTHILEFPESAPRPTASIDKRSKKTKSTGLAIEDLGDNRWHIPSQVAEDTRSNVGDLLKQAQAIPYLEGGKTTGFQIRMIQRGSLIEQIGLRKGDILREVNGVMLNSPEKALQIFGQLRQAKQISIGLERRGKAMTFAYEIR
jgi:general secretion pathway protein C